jgi:DNA-binding SARP family transcriptional activator
MRLLGRLLVRGAAGSILAATITAIPIWLVAAVGWPLPQRVPTMDSLTSWLTGTVSDRTVVNGIAIALWLVWLLFVQAVAAELRNMWRGIRTDRHLNPLRAVAATLIGALLMGSFLSTTAAASPASATTPAPASTIPVAAVSDRAAVGAPHAILVGDTRYTYTVLRGDYLSKIAAAWLGDADRWPEICKLNWHRHFPKTGGTLHDCDLIYPGWDLRLPADARPPTGATPAPPPAQPSPAVPDDGLTPAKPSPSPSASIRPSPSANNHTAAPSANQANPVAPTAPASSASAASPSASPSAASSAVSATPAERRIAAESDRHGVQLPDGTWMTWTLAAAITAAAALVWLQRRRRYRGEPDDGQPPELPPPVSALSRAVARNASTPLPTDEAARAAAVPELTVVPPGGIGLQGDGAHAAARAALVAALASGGPYHPDARGEVVIDAATLSTLIGSDAATLGPWPRLHIADDIDHAITIIETQLLQRSRILDEHSLSDLDTLRDKAPDEEALPPILLVADTPPPGARMRTKASLTLGADLHVSAVLLGEWVYGTTVDVAADGHTRVIAGQPAQLVPARLPVLSADAAVHILGTLREAHTGQPPTTQAAATIVPLAASRIANPAAPTAPLPAPPAGETAGGKARLRVLGPPRIEGITAPGRDLRRKARELAVFLACHPDGTSTREIGEYLEPEARVKQADQRVHTNASNLRHNLARTASADTKNAYVVKAAGRYRLDPDTVDVDIWQLRDLLRHGNIATGPQRRALLTQACNLYTAPLAEGQDYEWITAHRETVRQWGTEAHLLLAEDLLDHDPQAASDLLDKAIRLDCYNEALYGKAMHARHALGDADGIRHLLRALTKALADLDAEPEEDTLALAADLRTSLETR